MIVIPMAGLSRRFSDAGFQAPKYMLEAHGKTLFEWSVLSFEKYFSSHEFLFVVRDIMNTEAFVCSKADKLGITQYQVCVLDEPTSGQAETVSLALHKMQINNTDPLTIFNIDTFRKNFSFPKT